MPKKGKEKNTVNKAKHAKLVARKKKKITSEKDKRKERLAEIVKKMKADERTA